ncbi:hypothetical protein E3P88_00685, partial [Wallemia ichthyophaga]
MHLKLYAALALISAVLAQMPSGEGGDLLQGLDKTLEVPEGSLKNQTLSEPPAWATSKAETPAETSSTGARPVETGIPDEAKKQIKQAMEEEAAKDDEKTSSDSPSPAKSAEVDMDDKKASPSSAKPAEAAEAPKPTSNTPDGKADEDKLLGGSLMKRQIPIVSDLAGGASKRDAKPNQKADEDRLLGGGSMKR